MLLSKEELLLSVRQGGGPCWGVNVPLGPINLHLDGQFLARCGLQPPPRLVLMVWFGQDVGVSLAAAEETK